MLAEPRRPSGPGAMHLWNDDIDALADAVIGYALERVRLDPVPLDGPRPSAELAAAAGETITPDGIGGAEALRLFTDVLAPACISTDHPRNLSFVPCAPTKVAVLFDLVVGASSIYGGSWLEGAGAVFAENQALRFIADLAGLPAAAGGAFVQGGTTANLSGLVAARDASRRRSARASATSGADRSVRLCVVAGPEAHSSIAAAASVMDIDVVVAEPTSGRRLTGASVRAAVERTEAGGDRRVFAVVATAGTTNLGLVDDLASVARAVDDLDLWLHVDGAYGGAALAAPSARDRFTGIERADSLVVDPHKWLFAPFDCAALLYRDPTVARQAHAQHAGYLDVLHATGEWNPSDYAVHLTRRARGLPFWFSLATYGTRHYEAAIERTLDVARHAALSIRRRPDLELLLEPDLSVVCFRRSGWAPERYFAWSEQLRREQVAFVTPTTVDGETVARLAIVNPLTTEADIDLVLDSMVP